ncbi:monocarboxylate transporter 2-like [Diadema antillarum]|uniref:monocarboxylate transporter 2-like n=1 Tax=Diadema antillarum TaxID=105358 RepID=UPI003A88BB00
MAAGSENVYGRVILVARFSFFWMEIGLAKSFGVLVPELEEQLHTSNAIIGLIASLSMATMYLGAPIAQIMLNHSSHPRLVTSLSGLLAGVAFILSAFTRNVVALSFLFFTTGFCCAILNLQVMVLLYQYFPDDFAYVSCISVLGIPVGAAVLPPVTEMLLETYGLSGSLLIVGAVVLHMFPIGLVMRPRKRLASRPRDERDKDKAIPLMDSDNPAGSQTDALHSEAVLAIEIQDKSKSTKKGISAILRAIQLDVLIKEPIFTAFLLPSVLLVYLATSGWALFLVVYALYEGVDLARGAYLATSGACGGVCSSALMSVMLRFRGQWSPQLYILSLCIASVGFFIQLLDSSYPYLVATSFIIGFGVFGSNVTMEAVLSWLVSPENFADASNPFFFCVGLGCVLAGYTAGSIQDRTNNPKMVFVFLGSSMIAALVFILGGCLAKWRRSRRMSKFEKPEYAREKI